jgi:hypothetical protein
MDDKLLHFDSESNLHFLLLSAAEFAYNMAKSGASIEQVRKDLIDVVAGMTDVIPVKD